MKVNFDHDLDEFAAKISAVDMEKAVDEGMEEAMETLLDYTLQNIRDDGLTGFTTNDNRGEGPALATRAAWTIEQTSDNTWVIRTKPKVAERAFYLEYGTNSPITPNNADRFKFENKDGQTIYPKSVSGVEEHRFWRDALARFRSENVMSEEIESAVSREFKEKGL